ncbi:MAG: pyruvate kinase [Candidatus Buchananbacteria bacterium]
MFIVATISKNSYSAEKVKEIILAGATVLRYNFSHGSPEEMIERVKIAQTVINQLGLAGQVKILADLPGSKIRLGNFVKKEQPAKKDQEIIFKSAIFSEDPLNFVPVDFTQIGLLVSLGQVFTLGDGEIAFMVTQVLDQESFRAKALNDGLILNLKGINIGAGIDQLDHLNEKTIAHIKNLPLIKPEWVAFSFVNSAEYLKKAKALLAAVNLPDWQPKIVSKIESPLAISNINEIIEETDIVMVARGDLGLTVPIENLGLMQKEIIKLSGLAGKPVIVATHVLGSLLNYYVPARAEVVDLTQIVLDGADGIMLTKETGISLTPGYSVFVAKKIIETVEKYQRGNLNLQDIK